MSDPERWQATGRIVVSGFHEGGKGGGSEGEPGWREVCGLLWWRGAVGGGAGGGRGGAQKQCTGLENTGRCIQV